MYSGSNGVQHSCVFFCHGNSRNPRFKIFPRSFRAYFRFRFLLRIFWTSFTAFCDGRRLSWFRICAVIFFHASIIYFGFFVFLYGLKGIVPLFPITYGRCLIFVALVFRWLVGSQFLPTMYGCAHFLQSFRFSFGWSQSCVPNPHVLPHAHPMVFFCTCLRPSADAIVVVHPTVLRTVDVVSMWMGRPFVPPIPSPKLSSRFIQPHLLSMEFTSQTTERMGRSIARTSWEDNTDGWRTSHAYRCRQVTVGIHLRLSSRLRSNQRDDPHGQFVASKFGEDVANVAQLLPSSRKMHHSCGPKQLKRAC